MSSPGRGVSDQPRTPTRRKQSPLSLRRPQAPSPFTQITLECHGRAICPLSKASLDSQRKEIQRNPAQVSHGRVGSGERGTSLMGNLRLVLLQARRAISETILGCCPSPKYQKIFFRCV